MGRAKTKKLPRRAAPTKATKGTAKSNDSGGSEVERRWKEYWACRKQLEDAVEKVRAATEVLKSTQEQEKARRTEFEEIKRSLTKLLDVDPVAAASVREPIPIQRSLPEAPPKETAEFGRKLPS